MRMDICLYIGPAYPLPWNTGAQWTPVIVVHLPDGRDLFFFFASVSQTDGSLSMSYWPVTICLYSTYFFTVFLLFEHIKWSISKKSKLVCFCVNQLLYLVWYKYHMSKLSRTLRSVSALAACLQRGSSQWWNVYSGLGWQTRVWLHWNYIPVDPGR